MRSLRILGAAALLILQVANSTIARSPALSIGPARFYCSLAWDQNLRERVRAIFCSSEVNLWSSLMLDLGPGLSQVAYGGHPQRRDPLFILPLWSILFEICKGGWFFVFN